MRSIFRYCVGVIIFAAAAVSASGQNIGSYTWTNVLAFPSLPSFAVPVCITSPPGETNRLFIVEHSGDIVVVTNLAAPNRTVFLNLASEVYYTGESGILGLAFHPGFATNGYFYVSYTSGSSSAEFDVLSRFQVSATNPNQGNLASELKLFSQPDRANNHNAGDLHFGPDGYLYVAVGDEGNEHNTLGNAQHIDLNLFSGILRIDVNNLPGNLPPNPSPTSAVTSNYSIPSDNPFVGATSFDGLPVNPNQVRTEFWAVGLRNPWRFSFDRVTGLLYCGDVGQDTVEEVDIINKGGNYGWATYEGTLSPPPGVTTNGQPVAQNVTFPIIKYTHGSATNQGNCVIGGVVYRGSRFPELNGAYVYADYSTARFWATFYDGTNASNPISLFTASAPTSFGVDPRNGDVLYTENGGNIKRLIPLKPVITSIGCYETNIMVCGAGGSPGSPCYLLCSPDMTPASWVRIATNNFDSLANFSFTNSMSSGATQMFYRISK